MGCREPPGVGSTGARREKSNEITAIPLLLQQLTRACCIVTIDAMGTQTKIAQQIIEQQGEYALALKENHGCSGYLVIRSDSVPREKCDRRGQPIIF
jgi:hypothetical protein